MSSRSSVDLISRSLILVDISRSSVDISRFKWIYEYSLHFCCSTAEESPCQCHLPGVPEIISCMNCRVGGKIWRKCLHLDELRKSLTPKIDDSETHEIIADFL